MRSVMTLPSSNKWSMVNTNFSRHLHFESSARLWGLGLGLLIVFEVKYVATIVSNLDQKFIRHSKSWDECLFSCLYMCVCICFDSVSASRDCYVNRRQPGMQGERYSKVRLQQIDGLVW